MFIYQLGRLSGNCRSINPLHCSCEKTPQKIVLLEIATCIKSSSWIQSVVSASKINDPYQFKFTVHLMVDLLTLAELALLLIHALCIITKHEHNFDF